MISWVRVGNAAVMAFPMPDCLLMLQNGDTIADGSVPHAKEHERWCLEMKNSLPLAIAYLSTRRVTAIGGNVPRIRIGRKNIAIIHKNPLLSIVDAAMELSENSGKFWQDGEEAVDAMNGFEDAVFLSGIMDFKMAYNARLKTYLCACDGRVVKGENPIICLISALIG